MRLAWLVMPWMIAGCAVGTTSATDPPRPASSPPGVAEASVSPPRYATHRDARGDLLPAGAVARLGSARLRHPVEVTALAWSADGERLVSVDSQGEIRSWDGRVGRRAAKAPSIRGGTIAISPDGTWLAVGGEDLSVHALADGVERWRQPTRPPIVRDVAFHPEGALLAAAVGTTVEVRDAGTGGALQRWTEHEERVERVTWSPDGGLLASADRGGLVLVRDTASGELVTTFRLTDGSWPPVVLSFTRDGSLLLAGDDPIELREGRTGAFVGELRGFGPIAGAAASADGTLLTSHAPPNHRLVRWNLTERRGALAWSTATPSARGAVAAHAERIAIADPIGGIALVAQADGRRLDEPVGHVGEIASVVFHPTSTRAWTGGEDGYVMAWDVTSGTPTRYDDRHPGGVHRMAADATGTRLITSGWDGLARVWEPGRVKARRVLTTGSGADVGWRHDGVPVTYSAERGLVVWAPEGERTLAPGRPGPMRVDPTGRRAVLPGVDGPIVADLEDGALLARLRAVPSTQSMLQDAAWSPDGEHIAFAGADGRTWIVDVNGSEAVALEGPHGVVTSIAWSADGRQLASAHDEGTWVWDVTRRAIVATLQGHDGYTTHVAWTADGARIATASTDGTVLLWTRP